MSIEGTYAFYSAANGPALASLRLNGRNLMAVDNVGRRYSGTARENEDGTIALEIEFDVKPGMTLVQGAAPEELSYRRGIAQLPAGFGHGRPIEPVMIKGCLTSTVAPGKSTVFCHRSPGLK